MLPIATTKDGGHWRAYYETATWEGVYLGKMRGARLRGLARELGVKDPPTNRAELIELLEERIAEINTARERHGDFGSSMQMDR